MTEPKTERSAVNRVIKYILFFVNVLLWVGGLALTVAGAYILVVKEKVVRVVLDFFLDPSCMVTLVGAIAVVLCTCGCMGSLRENRCLLQGYHWVMSILLFLQLAAGIVLFLFYYVPDVKKTIQGAIPSDVFQDAIINYQDDDDTKDLIDGMQQFLQCCGWSDSEEGYKDWNDNLYFNCTEASTRSSVACAVPTSCCIFKKDEVMNLLCGAGALRKTPEELDGIVYTSGCIKALGVWIESNALLIGGCLLGILLPQIILVWLARRLDDQVDIQLERQRRSR